MDTPEIGIIGGSGFYALHERPSMTHVHTPYGPPSEEIALGDFHGKVCAFLPRHGKLHHLPPHRVPYRANMSALAELGVTQIIAMTAVGALSTALQPGEIVIADQLVDYTHGTRPDTFFEGPVVTHIGFSEPYCSQMREVALTSAASSGIKVAPRGTIVVTAGPRFSTKAESDFFAAQGWELENMTQYPEAVLARELGMSYLNVSLVTNSCVPAEGPAGLEINAASEAMAVLASRLPELINLLGRIVENLPPDHERPAAIRDAIKNGRWVK